MVGGKGSTTHPRGVALALGRAAEVVDDDARAAGAEEQGVDLAETAASTGDDDDLAVVPQLISHTVKMCLFGGLGGKGREEM